MSIITNQSPSSDRLALIYRIKQATVRVRVAILEIMLWKAGFRPDQPRVPAGNTDGGQWIDEDGDTDLLLVQGDPNEFPETPEDPPPTTRERNSIAVRIARFLLATNSVVQAESIRRWVWEHARDRKSIILLNKLRRGRMDSRRSGFRDGEIWCASQPIDTGRSQDGMRHVTRSSAACHHGTISVAKLGRSASESVLEPYENSRS